MNTRRVRERVEDAVCAARLLCDTRAIVDLAVDAAAAACPRALALAFTRRTDGTHGVRAAHFDGVVLARDSLRPGKPPPWVVNIDCVPDWQQNCWIEPMRAGVHGPDYFFNANHPATAVIDAPQYGRMMVCSNARLIAWIGVFVDSRYDFTTAEQTSLRELASRLAMPLQIAAALDDDVRRIALAPRQSEILSRVALGWTNKRIGRDLGISPATVKTVLERLFRVSGSANRAALVEWWRRPG
jgi:DNA-binding CsgD family transcriptional regulator